MKHITKFNEFLNEKNQEEIEDMEEMEDNKRDMIDKDLEEIEYTKDTKICNLGESDYYLQYNGWVTTCSNKSNIHTEVYETPLPKVYREFMSNDLALSFDKFSLWK